MSNFTNAAKQLDNFVQMHESLQYVKDFLANIGNVEAQAQEATATKISLMAEIEGYRATVEKTKQEIEAAQAHLMDIKQQEVTAINAAKENALSVKQRAKNESDVLLKVSMDRVKAALVITQNRADKALSEAIAAEKRTTVAIAQQLDIVNKINKLKASF